MDWLWECWLRNKVSTVAAKVVTAPVKRTPAMLRTIKEAWVECKVTTAVVATTTVIVAAPVVLEPIILPPPAEQHALREEPADPPMGPFYWGHPAHGPRLGTMHDHGTGDLVLSSTLAAADNGGLTPANDPIGAPVPEPGTLFLIGTGLVAIAVCKRKGR